MSRIKMFMSCQVNFLASGVRSKYEGWYVTSTLA
jgi:hypothetical protein